MHAANDAPIGSGFLLVTCTTATRANAEAIARALVDQRLAACVQFHPVESVYRWNDALQLDAEIALHIKTTAARLRDVEALIVRLHTYELPEIVWIEIGGGSAGYLAWLARSVQPPASEPGAPNESA